MVPFTGYHNHTNEGACGDISLWPSIFISDLLQSIIFLLAFLYVSKLYSKYILYEVRLKIQFYCVVMILRPCAILLFHVITSWNEDVSHTALFLLEILLSCLFYYLLFRMRLIQIIMQYNM